LGIRETGLIMGQVFRCRSRIVHVKIVLAAAVSIFAWTGAATKEGCNNELERIERYGHVIHSLRPDKPGQAHVYAADGSAFTPAEAFWMQAQLRKIETACKLDASPDALERLEHVRWLINSRAQR
jgi:hypothetical protein